MRQRLLPAPVLLLALAATSLSACHLGISLNAEARNEWTRDYTLADGGTFEIRNTNGQVTLEVGDGDKVRVAAQRVVNASTQDAADTALESFEIGERVSPDHITHDSTSRGLSINLSRKVIYRVTVPRWANVTLSGTNNSIDATGVEGRFTVDVTNGRVTAAGLAGPTSVETTNGAVSLGMARLGDDGLRCETTNGSITIMLPPDAGADVDIRVTNGGISHDGLSLDVIDQSRRQLEARVAGGGPPVRLRATNGAIRLRPSR